MGKIHWSLLFSCFFVLSVAQEKDTINISQGIPFVIIEKAPRYPGYETLRQNLHKLCLQNQISKHVAQNFNMPIADSLNLKPGKATYLCSIYNK